VLIKDKVKIIIEDALKQAVVNGEFPDIVFENFPEVKIEYPKDTKFGDYASSIAMESARVLKKSPMMIGEKIKKYIDIDGVIDGVSIAQPGFINLFLSRDFIGNYLSSVIVQGGDYGRSEKESPLKIILEFVSANPTGPLNIVSARAAALGDTLANILEAAGDSVDREFYVNDYGNQVNLFGKSVYFRYREINNETVEFPEDGYQGEYVKDIALYIKENFSTEVSELKDEDSIIEYFAVKAIDYILGSQKSVMESFGVKYQQWFKESYLHKNNLVLAVLDFIKSKGVVYEQEGKQVFRSTDYGDDKDRVLLRKDGRPTYLLADIAYHKNKLDRGYDLLIDIWGPDHHGYIARLKGAIKAMGFPPSCFKVLIAQQVNLLMEGNLVKMSKRLGRFSTMSDLLEEVGSAVSRYFFVMRSMDSHLDFDLSLAKKQSSENPVFYLQYAHARICSIFRESLKKDAIYDIMKYDVKYFDSEAIDNLLKLVIKFPDEIRDAAQTLEPHRITNYLMRLSQSFHKFYAEHRVLSEEIDKTQSYLALCESVKIVLKNGLNLLGVPAPEQM